MTVKIVPRGRSFLATVNRGGNRFRKQFKSYSEAEIWGTQAEADIVAGRPPQSSSPEVSQGDKPKTLEDLIDYTWRNHWSHDKSGQHSKRNAEQCAEILKPTIKIKDIDVFKIDRLVITFQEQHKSNGTINRKLAALSKCLKVAKDLGLINFKPKIAKLPEKDGRIRWFTDEELDRMVAYFRHIGNNDFAHWVRFQVDTGLRCSETQKITWTDVGDGFVTIPDSKSGKPRGVPLTEAAKDALEGARRQPHGPFRFATSGYRRRWWDRLRLHMGWINDSEAVPHALRHTFCSRLVQRGAPLLNVQQLAGHQSFQTTLRYAHLAPHNLVDTIKLLESSGPTSLSVVSVA